MDECRNTDEVVVVGGTKWWFEALYDSNDKDVSIVNEFTNLIDKMNYYMTAHDVLDYDIPYSEGGMTMSEIEELLFGAVDIDQLSKPSGRIALTNMLQSICNAAMGKYTLIPVYQKHRNEGKGRVHDVVIKCLTRYFAICAWNGITVLERRSGGGAIEGRERETEGHSYFFIFLHVYSHSSCIPTTLIFSTGLLLSFRFSFLLLSSFLGWGGDVGTNRHLERLSYVCGLRGPSERVTPMATECSIKHDPMWEVIMDTLVQGQNQRWDQMEWRQWCANVGMIARLFGDMLCGSTRRYIDLYVEMSYVCGVALRSVVQTFEMNAENAMAARTIARARASVSARADMDTGDNVGTDGDQRAMKSLVLSHAVTMHTILDCVSSNQSSIYSIMCIMEEEYDKYARARDARIARLTVVNSKVVTKKRPIEEMDRVLTDLVSQTTFGGQDTDLDVDSNLMSQLFMGAGRRVHPRIQQGFDSEFLGTVAGGTMAGDTMAGDTMAGVSGNHRTGVRVMCYIHWIHYMMCMEVLDRRIITVDNVETIVPKYRHKYMWIKLAKYTPSSAPGSTSDTRKRFKSARALDFAGSSDKAASRMPWSKWCSEFIEDGELMISSLGIGSGGIAGLKVRLL